MANNKSTIDNQIQRDDYELDQKQAAKKLGVSTKTIRNWANKKPKKADDPSLTKQMLHQPNGAQTPQYSKSEVRELKKKLAEKKKSGKKPESSTTEAGSSAPETTSLELPTFDLSDFPDAQKPFVFMVHQANSERRSLQVKLNQQIGKSAKLEKELEIKNDQLELIEKEHNAEQANRIQDELALKHGDEESEKQQSSRQNTYHYWIAFGVVLVSFLVYMLFLNTELIQRFFSL